MIDQLPDDVLAMVMSHLDVKDILACRLVCKRLAALAQHPDVWRHRRIDARVNLRPKWSPVLRLAPCVRKISTYVPIFGQRCHLRDLRTTSCAARELWIAINLETCGPEKAAEVVQIVKQQEALGRLRAVSFYWFSHGEKRAGILKDDSVDLLLGALASTRGLEAVTVGVQDRCGEQVAPTSGQRGTIAPSLKSFTCDILPWTVAFCNYMLAGHAATLEAVSFIGDDTSPIDAALSPIDATLSPLRLLVGMPNLRQLTSNVKPGLGDVAACESLRSLKLTLDPVSDNDTPGALELLRSAHQLRSIHLHFCDDDYEKYDERVTERKFAADLIRALASSGRSQVEMLFIEVERACLLDLLLDQLRLAIPSLPALRRLVVNMDPGGTLLRVITPLIAPSLRSFQILPTYLKPNLCSHALLHSEDLDVLMSRNPLLHVELQYLPCRCYPYQGTCNVCELSCHKDLKEMALVGVFAHPKDECPSPEVHAAIERRYWVHINDVKH